jgi:quinol monooxygenase YgiN
MYVRLARFTFGPGKQDEATKLARDLVPAIRARQGCGGVTFFGDDSTGEYGLFVQWDSKENADAASQVIGPRLQQHLAGNVLRPAEIHLFEVLERSA